MGDYVLESNPALERLIERHHEQGENAPLEEGSRSNGVPTDAAPDAPRRRHTHRFNRRASRAQSLVDASRPSEGTAGLDPRDVAPTGAAIVDDDLWAIHETLQPLDEMVLVGFDEEPEVFDEDLTGTDEDSDLDESDEDEVLDLYEDEDWVTDEWSAEDEGVEASDGTPTPPAGTLEYVGADDEDAFDEERWIVDEEDDEQPEEWPQVRGELSEDSTNWIFEAFEAWKRENAEGDAVVVS